MEWRIFFIGPMGSAPVEAGGSSALNDDIGAHLPKLMKHLVDYLQNKQGYTLEGEQKHTLTEGDTISSISLVKDEEKITILTPFDLYGPGDIPSNVFDAIDDSDLIIADLSGNKPAVIYELAFAHALGIRTIVVGGPNERSFYFSQTRFAEVDFTANPISSTDLNGHINDWVKNKNKRFDSPNPLTDFYGAPLPDISAAAGLGASFYDNFARPILTDGNIVEKKPDGSEDIRPLKGLIVIRPENFDQRIKQVEEALLKELNDKFQGPKLAKKKKKEIKRGKRGEIFIQTKEGERTQFFLVDDWIIDVPRAMFSLALSPRLERSSNSKKNKSLRHNMERVLIERFFEAIKKHLVKERSIIGEEEKFHYGSIEEIPKIIETGKSTAWD
jgi:hypothetical protein